MSSGNESAALDYIRDQGEIILSEDQKIQHGLKMKLAEYKKRQDDYTAQKCACVYIIRELFENGSVRAMDAIKHVDDNFPRYTWSNVNVRDGVYRIVNYNACGHCDGKYLPGMEV